MISIERCSFISIHALLAESDRLNLLLLLISSLFLSTLSLRRATLLNRRLGAVHNAFLSTLSLRRATTSVLVIRQQCRNFYPRSPCGERHTNKQTLRPTKEISIHALLAESDKTVATEVGGSNYFYPRSPCGERHR